MKREEREIALIELDLEDESLQGRIFYDEGKIANLASDIKQFGQRASIGVRASPKNKLFQIIYGFQRVKATKKLGRANIKAILYSELTEREAEELAVRDNEMHGDLTEIEKALQCSRLKEQDWSIEELCKAYNTKKTSVYNWLQVANSDKVLVGLIHRDFLTVYQGLEIMREPNYSRRLEIIKNTIKLGWGVRQIRNYLETKTFGDRVFLSTFIDFCPRHLKDVSYKDTCEKCDSNKGERKKHKDGTTKSFNCSYTHPIKEFEEFHQAYQNREPEPKHVPTREEKLKHIAFMKETLARDDLEERGFKREKLEEYLKEQEEELDKIKTEASA